MKCSESKERELQNQMPPHEQTLNEYYLGFQSKEDKALYFDLVLFRETTAKLFLAKLDPEADFYISLTREQYKWFELDLKHMMERKGHGNFFDEEISCRAQLGYCAPMYNEAFEMFKCRYGCGAHISDREAEKGREDEIIVGKLWLDMFLRVFKNGQEQLEFRMADIKGGRALLIKTTKSLTPWACKGFLPCQGKQRYFI